MVADVTESDMHHYERHIADESEARSWAQGCAMTLVGLALQVAGAGLPQTALGIGVTLAIALNMALGVIFFGVRLRRLSATRPHLLKVIEGGR